MLVQIPEPVKAVMSWSVNSCDPGLMHQKSILLSEMYFFYCEFRYPKHVVNALESTEQTWERLTYNSVLLSWLGWPHLLEQMFRGFFTSTGRWFERPTSWIQCKKAFLDFVTLYVAICLARHLLQYLPIYLLLYPLMTENSTAWEVISPDFSK